MSENVEFDSVPVATRRDHQWLRPTGAVNDPYAWLAKKDDPSTIAYLNAENAFADKWFERYEQPIEDIFQEIKSRVKEDDVAPPVQKRQWWYTTKTETGKSYAIHSRGRTADTATDIVLLDENIEADGHEYFAVSAFDIGTNDSLLAWASDTNGSELYDLKIRDITTGQDLPDVIRETSWGGTAWSRDDQWLFYVRPDDAMRPWQVWRHKIGSEATEDVMVFEEPDERFFVGVDRTRSDQWIVIESSSRTSSEAWIIPADEPTTQPVCFMNRQDNIEYSIDHWGDIFVVLTNKDGVDFSVMTAPEHDTRQWVTLISHELGSRVVQFDCFSNHAVMQRWVRGQQVISLVSREGLVSPIHISDEPHEADLDANPNFITDGVRFSFQSLTTPATVAWYSMSEQSITVLKRTDVPNADLSQYVSSRIWAQADDGTQIPVDFVHHRSTALDGTAPACVYGYGSYEVSLPPWFSAARLSLLDRGWVWALVHPRGGGEMGRQWYEDGKLLNKRNTFTDTIACTRHLIDTNICAPDAIVIRGGSAGGLLVGACITLAPDLFTGAIAEVPFVDVVNTMSDPSLPLTVTEWEEWGDPRSEPFASYIGSYSPYDNTIATTYPSLYVTAGLNDPRVSYHEPAKWVARLRHVSPQTNVVFKCEMGAGHGGPSGRYDRWRDEARTLVFALAITNNISAQN
jgi:oligopeptidase B